MKTKVIEVAIAAVCVGIASAPSYAKGEFLPGDATRDVIHWYPRQVVPRASRSFDSPATLIASSAPEISPVEADTAPRRATAGYSSYEDGNCGLKFVQIRYSHPADLKSACEGIKRAQKFFLNYGFKLDGKEIVIVFKNEVRPPSTLVGSQVIQAPRVYGFYNRSTGVIELSSWDTVYLKNRSVFGSLPVTLEYHSSVAAHEIAHRYHHLIAASMGSEMGHANSEFIAYSVQIESMQENDRHKVLALWPGAKLQAETHVNSMIWGAAPHRFGVMAYRMWKEHPTDLVKRILTGKFQDHDRILWSGL